MVKGATFREGLRIELPLAGWGSSERSLHVLPVLVWVLSASDPNMLIDNSKLAMSVNGNLALCLCPAFCCLSIRGRQSNRIDSISINTGIDIGLTIVR